MKHKKIMIVLILILLIMIIAICFFKSANLDNTGVNVGNKKTERMVMNLGEENQYKKGQKNTTINDTCEIKSALIENIELHATYYLSEVYVEQNQYIEKGANILKYTNGNYLTAPYDCYIIELNLPESEGKCLNSNYVKVESKKMLSVSTNVDETQIDKIKVGNEAVIEVPAIDKTYTGYITHIGSVATNGKFEVTIEFENDGNVSLGMTSNVKIVIESKGGSINEK